MWAKLAPMAMNRNFVQRLWQRGQHTAAETKRLTLGTSIDPSGSGDQCELSCLLNRLLGIELRRLKSAADQDRTPTLRHQFVV